MTMQAQRLFDKLRGRQRRRKTRERLAPYMGQVATRPANRNARTRP